MEREEEDELSPCAECGALVPPGSERAFAFGDGEVLCWECSIRRGGSFDAEEERWVRQPSTKDMRRPRP
ncbi:MAG: hypothetical protein L0Z55_12100 [Planctomycetes bacterium]|nr:hypothetical protein [Planctomycetota bacterium]